MADKIIDPAPVIKRLANRCLAVKGMECTILGEVIDMLRDEPAVDAVEVVHGRWIHCQGKSNLWYCSECGEKILYNPTRRTYNIEKRPVHEVNKYCRGCGAIMDGGNDDGICKES